MAGHHLYCEWCGGLFVCRECATSAACWHRCCSAAHADAMRAAGGKSRAEAAGTPPPVVRNYLPRLTIRTSRRTGGGRR